MSAPPAKKSKESTTVSMIFSGKEDCLSPVTRINGYPWCLRLLRKDYGTNRWEIFVRCEKSMESELWSCEADIKSNEITERKYKFESAYKNGQEHHIGSVLSCVGNRLDVFIAPTDNGSKWLSRPVMGYVDPRDGILVIEDKKIYVNKESLASQSSYFDRLFNGDFKEKNMKEIPIGDVSAEEFTNMIRMLYGKNDASVINAELTRENVHRILELADRFELKIVEDGVVNVLLSPSSFFSIHERLLIADQNGLTTCKDRVIALYTGAQLADLCESPQFDQLSGEMKKVVIKKLCDFARAGSRK